MNLKGVRGKKKRLGRNDIRRYGRKFIQIYFIRGASIIRLESSKGGCRWRGVSGRAPPYTRIYSSQHRQQRHYVFL